jgi:acyl-CoA synthetase (AMP-forming)/AMP-acid ligase II
MTDRTIADRIAIVAAAGEDESPALISCTNRITSWGELDRRLARLVEWLRHEVGAGEVVATIGGSGVAGLELLIAAGSNGVCCPLGAGRSANERLEELRTRRPHLLIVVGGTGVDPLDADAAAALNVPVVHLSNDDDVLDLDGLPSLARPARRDPLAIPAGTAFLIGTSGTTGASKLVPLGTEVLLRAAESVARTLGLTRHDRCLNVMPLSHTHGLVGAVLSSLVSGGSVVCHPGYDDDRFLASLTRHRPTWYTAVPAVHDRLQALVAAGRLPHHDLRFARSASAHLPSASIERFQEVLSIPLLQAYALTEAPGQISSQAVGDPTADGTVGMPRDCRIRVVGANGDVEPGETGDILVQGGHVAPGYLADVTAPLQPHAAGWLRTGDCGKLLGDGRLVVSGRRDDLINRAGEKIQPLEIEDQLRHVPGVVDVAVFGVPDNVLGQAVRALVAGNTTRDAVLAHARHALSAERIPDEILIVDAIPRSSTGKVNRRELAELTFSTDATSASALDVLSGVSSIWSRVLLFDAPDPEAHFLDLGGTSLQGARIEALTSRRFSVVMPPAVILREASTIHSMTMLVSELVEERNSAGV